MWVAFNHVSYRTAPLSLVRRSRLARDATSSEIPRDPKSYRRSKLDNRPRQSTFQLHLLNVVLYLWNEVKEKMHRNTLFWWMFLKGGNR